jgi:hypothetical protein
MIEIGDKHHGELKCSSMTELYTHNNTTAGFVLVTFAIYGKMGAFERFPSFMLRGRSNICLPYCSAAYTDTVKGWNVPLNSGSIR